MRASQQYWAACICVFLWDSSVVVLNESLVLLINVSAILGVNQFICHGAFGYQSFVAHI